MTRIGRVKRCLWYAGCICIVTAVLAAGGFAQGTSQMIDEPLCRAMEEAKITPECATVDLWGRFDSMAGDTARQTELADSVARLIEGEIGAREEVRAGRRMIRRSGQCSACQMAVAVAENITPNGSGEVCLAVRLTGNRTQLGQLLGKCEQIMEIGGNFGAKLAINTCLRGYISGKIKSTEKTAYLDDLLTRLGAKKVSMQTHERYISCTAYSPMMEDVVRLGRENINLQIVFRDTNERTEVYLGTPLLMMEY